MEATIHKRVSDASISQVSKEAQRLLSGRRTVGRTNVSHDRPRRRDGRGGQDQQSESGHGVHSCGQVWWSLKAKAGEGVCWWISFGFARWRWLGWWLGALGVRGRAVPASTTKMNGKRPLKGVSKFWRREV